MAWGTRCVMSLCVRGSQAREDSFSQGTLHSFYHSQTHLFVQTHPQYTTCDLGMILDVNSRKTTVNALRPQNQPDTRQGSMHGGRRVFVYEESNVTLLRTYPNTTYARRRATAVPKVSCYSELEKRNLSPYEIPPRS